MGLFSPAQIDKINKVAAKSKEVLKSPKSNSSKGMNSELNEISNKLIEYFKDSPAILITTVEELHDYISKCIEYGYAGIDTETTGLDRIHDTIVGFSIYCPGQPEAYIPCKHLIPIFDELYKNQLSYEECGKELQRLVDANTRLIFANADFDIAMIYKDFKVDLVDICYYDVILAWRCLKENEKDNALKTLYNKYVLKGKGDPMKFRDFFSPKLFPYCKPIVARLYAANDAKITFELFLWQLPYVTKSNAKCQKNRLEKIADLVWNIEFPMIKVCAMLHRVGVYLDNDTAISLKDRYNSRYKEESDKLHKIVQELINNKDIAHNSRRPFRTGADFNPNSTVHVKYLVNKLLGSQATSTGKEVLEKLNQPSTDQILRVRGLVKLLSTYVEKLPNNTTSDSRIHATFKSIGADTGRMSSADPNMQNIPSHATDIRHMFRATPGYVMMSSDYSQQEPKLTAFAAQEPKMIETFQKGKDIYATIASIAFNLPYEECLEFHPETHEYQPDGKARRSIAKVLVLGINYGMSTESIGQDLWGDDKSMSDEERTKKAQKIFDAVMLGFPHLRDAILGAQHKARTLGYTETILGRRRHHPDMQLPEFEFEAMPGYVNPDIDPLDVNTLSNKSAIPDRIVEQLKKEFKGYKYYGQIVKRTKELYEQKIKVVNNRYRISEASRQVWNAVIQGSAAELTKMAILKLTNNPEWNEIGGRFLVPVHDELIVEVPFEKRAEGARILKECMEGAGDFLPFTISCDIEETFRWYGLAVDDILSFDKPKDMNKNTWSESNIKWLQSRLFECEYLLPILKDKEGNKPIGIAAHGVNGVWTAELDNCINSYLTRFNVTEQDFLEDIDKRVVYGDTNR